METVLRTTDLRRTFGRRGATVEAADQCAASPNQAETGGLTIEGPSQSSDSSPSFTMTITWIAGP